jgi:predicted amidohydrolase YtcJ
MKHLVYSLLLLGMTSCNHKQEVDAIIYSAKLYTSTDSNAEALAVKDGKVVAIGSNIQIQEKYSSDSIIDAQNAYIYPGFIDAHCHFSSYALTLYQCDLVETKSYNDVLKKLVEYEKNNSLNWIYGRGWDQNDWDVKNYPDNTELNKLFPDKPVMLKRVDGHAALCNNKALEMAGISVNTVISGGIVEKKNGKLTGILIDNATDPVEKIIGDLPEKEAEKYLKILEEKCFGLGLTGLVECGVKTNALELLKKLYRDGSLSISNVLQLSNDSQTIDKYLSNGPFREGSLIVNGVKIYADGALGSRGACLLQPYNDMPGQYGLILTRKEEIKAIAERANKYGWQVATHAIGDSANRMVLRTYAEVLRTKNDKRWRIEHAQVVNYNDYMYFSDYSIIPSVQPTHAISDMPWAINRLGEKRLPEAYAYKALLNLNGWIALGTDFPVEDINPLATFYTAVARKDKSGKPANGYMKQNVLSREESLKGMTIWAAKSVFLEKEKGSIEIGKDADLIILDKDIMTIPENEILNAKVLYTISMAKIKYRAK